MLDKKSHPHQFDVFTAFSWNSLPLELLMLSCSVQTIVQRLKRHLFFSSSMSLYEYFPFYVFFIIIINIKNKHITLNNNIWIRRRCNIFNIKNRKHTNVWVSVHISKLTQYSTKKVKYICKTTKFISRSIAIKSVFALIWNVLKHRKKA